MQLNQSQTRTIWSALTALFVAVVLSVALPAQAKSKFDPVITVNGQAITQFEIDQRTKFLKALRQPGVDRKSVEDGLIEEKLKFEAARRAGIAMTEEGLTKAMENFAGRANLKLPEFLAALARQGIEEVTMRDFVKGNVLWREVVRSRFGSRGNVSEKEVDRTMAALSRQGGIRVAISEIILPAPPRQLASARRQAERLSRIRSTSRFAAQARKVSVSQSRRQSGRLPAMDLSELPPPLQPIIMALKPGQVTTPIEVKNAILLFQLRSIEETSAKPQSVSAVEYAQIAVPAASARNIAGSVDVCDDLYGVAKRNPSWTLARETLEPSKIDKGVAVELAKLDDNEVSISLPAGEGAVNLIMLCGRTLEESDDVSRDEVRAQLRQRRLGGLADSYLAELLTSAKIKR